EKPASCGSKASATCRSSAARQRTTSGPGSRRGTRRGSAASAPPSVPRRKCTSAARLPSRRSSDRAGGVRHALPEGVPGERGAMAQTRAIVKRRKAVRNIRKITRTMELIATARYKKALNRATEAEAFTRKIAELAADLTLHAGGGVTHPLLE